MVNDAYAPELLRSLFLYDPVTGRLCHKANRRRVKAGSCADSTRRADGYRQVALRLDGKQYQLKAHRVAWILEHGSIPDGLQVDHINGIREDNCLCNLRLVTQRENDQNRRKARGYGWNKGCSKWEAYIRVDGVRHHLGLFTSEAAARAAYLKAKARYHPSTPADLLQAA
ncbi:TPA: HNH endonuclease [Enterobacter hormaechei subsp. hoffmannii]|uniref:Homing endonuclease n=1 Tax=Caudovirales sp. ctilw2 TaxID=2826782 RepID=A0A8S5N7U6_9CAUD|nr:HNH endonuclease signature motif containing protein [Enterobacter hormaechei]EJC3531076.1 HNH endonuclease [Escherichia coli]ELY2482177.1 HNH endonuclease [Cronobacter sakazakii]DAD90312.1 MAG TPA: homing endonuclease [Caudovirales sp. ctilw2]HAS0828664.1 HNH endonuclease [Enterobacter hormaechei subsp. hoffmannii]ELY2504910.1 HNH endonuclease [Cronobacter sakazakii]